MMSQPAEIRDSTEDRETVRSVKPVKQPSHLTVELVHDVETFSALHSDWTALTEASSATIFQTFEWLFLWWKYFDTDPNRSLHILLFRSNGKLVGIAPLFIEVFSFLGITLHQRFRFLGCDVSHEGPLGIFTDYGPSDYLDIIGHPEYESEVARCLASYLQKHAWLYDEVEFTNVPHNSLLIKDFLPVLGLFGLHHRIRRSDVCPRLSVPASMEEYIQGLRPNVRHRLYQARRAASEEGFYSIETVDSPKKLHTAFHDLTKLHQSRWNRQGYLGIFADRQFQQFQEEVAKTFLERGWLWFKTARMNGSPIAARLAFKFKGCFYDYLTGFDDASVGAKRRPGLALLLSMIEDAVHSRVPTVDFLRGAEKYKFDLTSEVVYNWKISIQNPDAQHKIRARLHVVFLFFRHVFRHLSRERLLLQVQYREHGSPSFIFRYIAFRCKRLFQKIWPDPYPRSRTGMQI